MGLNGWITWIKTPILIVDASLVRCQCEPEFGSIRGLRIHQRRKGCGSDHVGEVGRWCDGVRGRYIRFERSVVVDMSLSQ